MKEKEKVGPGQIEIETGVVGKDEKPEIVESGPAEPKKAKRSFKQFCVDHKKKIIKFSILLVAVACFTLGCFFLFRHLGFLDKNSFKEMHGRIGGWIYVVFVLLFILQAGCLFIIPGNTTLFVSIGYLVFENFWVVLFMCVIGVWLSALMLFCVGRFGGRRVLYWLFKKEDVDQKLDWVTHRGATALPALFIIPFMPNDMLCMVCGASKLKLWEFLLIVLPCRVIEVLLLLCYPMIVTFFTSGRDVQDVIIFVNIVIIDVVLFILYYRAIIKLFRKAILRKKYVVVEKPYTVEEEVKIAKK
jgi:uncharacterized membrane protein YdjX (TVP38/TMEM64 family)